MFPVIVCIAKKEHHYIEEWVKYHLALGFKRIYLFDNEETPTYEAMLQEYAEFIRVIHWTCRPAQYQALFHFTSAYLFTTEITHAIHIDIDEFIALKKHATICEFIEEYIKDDCQGIAIQWRFFGSSGHTEQTDIPVTERFTMCEKMGNRHIKTLYKKDHFKGYNTCHDILLHQGSIQSTNGHIIDGPYNEDNIDLSIIQLNHYKCKTLPEFRYIRTRQRADYAGETHENVDENFRLYDLNEVEDLTAKLFYQSINNK